MRSCTDFSVDILRKAAPSGRPRLSGILAIAHPTPHPESEDGDSGN
jgi:hypothetical protein